MDIIRSGSKPGRADRSGQSASALSLFKVRLTLSTVPKKKSTPGPSSPLSPPRSSASPGARVPTFLFFSLFLRLRILVLSPLDLSSARAQKSVDLQERASRWVIPFLGPSTLGYNESHLDARGGSSSRILRLGITRSRGRSGDIDLILIRAARRADGDRGDYTAFRRLCKIEAARGERDREYPM